MTLTNLTVKDLGDIVEAEYTLTDGKTDAGVTQQIDKHALMEHMETWPDGSYPIIAVALSYLKQNLK